MDRQFSEYVTNEVKINLAVLADTSTSPTDYASSLYALGKELADVLLQQFPVDDYQNVCVACTVEDADYLAKGIIDVLEKTLFSVSLACFWNQRDSKLEVAPIIRRYREPSVKNANILVVVKSVISGACVVKTNLTNLIQDIEPKNIFVVAPVIHTQAHEKLEREFPRSVSKKFQYVYFAKDSEKQADGNLLPGIGGSIYQRLGFKDQAQKNQFTPELIKYRRLLAMSM
jgi:hypothetical protein